VSQKYDCRIEYAIGWTDWRSNLPAGVLWLTQMWDRFLNLCWFWLNYRRFREFVREVKAKGYDPRDIWWSRKTGFRQYQRTF
jgi:hypothetical protein